MNRARVFLLFALAAVSWVIVSCSGKAASPTKQTISALAGAAPTETMAAHLSHQPVARPAPRESATGSFKSPEHGVTFSYPRNFALREEVPEDDQSSEENEKEEATVDGQPGLRSATELKAEQPGAVLMATVVIPDDAYPNTNFAGGSVEFAIDSYETAQSCRQSPATRLGDAGGATGSTTNGDISFAWAETDQGAGSTEYFERDYAGFSKGTCYEFFVRVGVGPRSDDEPLKPANQKKILAQLEKIVTSLKVQPQPPSVLDQRPAGPAKLTPDWSDLSKP